MEDEKTNASGDVEAAQLQTVRDTPTFVGSPVEYCVANHPCAVEYVGKSVITNYLYFVIQSVANGESSEGDSPGAETSTAGEEGGEEVVAVEGAEEGADREEEEEGKHKGEDREREETGEGKRDDSTEGDATEGDTVHAFT